MKKILSIFLLLASICVAAQPPIPEVWGTRIHDEAHILSAQFVNDLEQRLKFDEDSTSNQIGILIIETLEDYPIEMYTLSVAEKWKLGQADKDNGVLLFIAVKDRKIRIETGEGVEGALPDALANQIIRNEIAPYFRQDNYEQGILAGVAAIQGAIAGEYRAEQQPTRRGKRGGSIIPFLIILFVIIIISRMRGGGRGGRRGGWSAGGGWFGPGLGGGFGGGGFGGGFGGGGFSGGGGGFGGGGSSGSW